MRAFDWSTTVVGPPADWPTSLKTAVRIVLTSRQSMWIGWGPHLETYLYNDAHARSVLKGKHPWALGRPTVEVWREIWDDVGPMLATASSGAEGVYLEEQLLVMERDGHREETHFSLSYSPIPGADGDAGGIL